MNDARLDALLAAADPLPAPLPEGIAHDAAARAARGRIRSSRRGPSVRQITLAAAGFAALAALVVALIIVAPGRDPAPAGGTLIAPVDRVLAPGFSLPVLVKGESHKVGWAFPQAGPRAVSPHPLIIIFAESWCEPCRAQVRAVQNLWATTAVGDLAVLGIAGKSGGGRIPARAWWRGLGATFPLAIDRDLRGARSFGVSAVPQTILVDRQGRVAGRLSGITDPAVLARDVDALLAEPAPPVPPAPSPIQGPVPASALDMAVFDRPPSAETAPHDLLTSTPRVYAESIRLALRTPSGHSIWMARAEGDVVVMASGRPRGIGSLGAHPAASLGGRGGSVMYGKDQPGTPWFFLGMAVDGYTRATGGGRSVPIRNNVFLFEGGKRFSHVTLSGPGGTRTIP